MPASQLCFRCDLSPFPLPGLHLRTSSQLVSARRLRARCPRPPKRNSSAAGRGLDEGRPRSWMSHRMPPYREVKLVYGLRLDIQCTFYHNMFPHCSTNPVCVVPRETTAIRCPAALAYNLDRIGDLLGHLVQRAVT